MDLTLFDDVLTLLEAGNMSRAARRRNVTQPAFSRRIQSFEAWLGRPIVKRSANRVEIEPALLANAAELQALVAHVQALRRRIAEHRPGGSVVTLAAQHSLIVSTFPPFAAAARRSLPMAAFRVRAGNQNECISLFLGGEASLLMCYEPEGAEAMPFAPSVVRSVWGRDRLVRVAGGDLRFALRPGGAPPEDAPVLRYPPNSFFGDLLGEAAAPGSRPSGPVVAESAFAPGVKEMALAGLGLGWLPMSLVGAEVRSGSLVVCCDAGQTIPLLITLHARPSDETAAQLCALR